MHYVFYLNLQFYFLCFLIYLNKLPIITTALINRMTSKNEIAKRIPGFEIYGTKKSDTISIKNNIMMLGSEAFS